MTDHITPEEARDMIAGARYEYAIARDSDYGWEEYYTQWGGWTAFKRGADWRPGREPVERAAKRVGGYIITRLVIDLEEEK